MGLFSSVTSAIKSTLTKAKILSPSGSIFSGNKPAQSTTPTLANYKSAIGPAIGSSILATSGVVKAVQSVASVIGSSSVAKSIATTVSTHPKTSVGAIVLAPSIIATGKEVISNPTPIVSAYVGQGKATSDLIGLAKNPSAIGVVEFGKEHPIASTVIGATAIIGGAVVGKGLLGAGATLANTLAVTSNTEATKEQNVLPTGQNYSPPTTHLNTTIPNTPNVSNVPILPQTTAVSKTSSTHRKKRHPVRTTPTNQSLRVNIYNQSRVNQSKTLYTRSGWG